MKPAQPEVRPIALAFALSLLVAGCEDRRPPFDVRVLERQLTAAGYRVGPAPIPDALAGYASVTCIEATKGKGRDAFCVIRCASLGECDGIRGHTGESFGEFQRGPSLLVHEACTTDTHSSLSADCTPARAAIGL